jgi:hypothetical protein
VIGLTRRLSSLIRNIFHHYLTFRTVQNIPDQKSFDFK